MNEVSEEMRCVKWWSADLTENAASKTFFPDCGSLIFTRKGTVHELCNVKLDILRDPIVTQAHGHTWQTCK